MNSSTRYQFKDPVTTNIPAASPSWRSKGYSFFRSSTQFFNEPQPAIIMMDQLIESMETLDITQEKSKDGQQLQQYNQRGQLLTGASSVTPRNAASPGYAILPPLIMHHKKGDAPKTAAEDTSKSLTVRGMK